MIFKHALTFATKLILCSFQKSRMKIAGIIPKILHKLEKPSFPLNHFLSKIRGFASDFPFSAEDSQIFTKVDAKTVCSRYLNILIPNIAPDTIICP